MASGICGLVFSLSGRGFDHDNSSTRKLSIIKILGLVLSCIGIALTLALSGMLLYININHIWDLSQYLQ